MKDARAELVSVYGDPFTLLNVFGEWLAVRDERGADCGCCDIAIKQCESFIPLGSLP